MIEAMLHEASTSLNSFGSLYVSLRFRQKRPARKKAPPVRTPAVNTAEFHECRTKVSNPLGTPLIQAQTPFLMDPVGDCRARIHTPLRSSKVTDLDCPPNTTVSLRKTRCRLGKFSPSTST